MLAALVCVLAACADVMPVKDFNLEKVTNTHLKGKKLFASVFGLLHRQKQPLTFRKQRGSSNAGRV